MINILNRTIYKGGIIVVRSIRSLPPQARQALDAFKYELASELGLSNHAQNINWEKVSSRECGMVGGIMFKQLVSQLESSKAEKRSNNYYK